MTDGVFRWLVVFLLWCIGMELMLWQRQPVNVTIDNNKPAIEEKTQ